MVACSDFFGRVVYGCDVLLAARSRQCSRARAAQHTTIDRQCASGLQAIAVAARSVIHDGGRLLAALSAAARNHLIDLATLRPL